MIFWGSQVTQNLKYGHPESYDQNLSIATKDISHTSCLLLVHVGEEDTRH